MNQQHKLTSWKKHIFEGFFFLAMTPFFFWYFTDFENSHDASRRMNWILATLYEIGGKWLVCAIVLALAICEFVAAGRKRRMQ